MSVKILATADLHGNLPTVAKCDLFIIAGDICPMRNHSKTYQAHWLDTYFRNWLAEIPALKIIGVAGNHDFVLEDRGIPERLHLHWTYLQDSRTHFEGLSFWGLPWVPNLPNWAFHQTKKGLAERYDWIPNDIDVVISHGPPRGIGDYSLIGHMLTGCASANNMMARVKPKAFINGHIHEGAGCRQFRSQHGHVTDVWNVSYVDENYDPRPSGIVQIIL